MLGALRTSTNRGAATVPRNRSGSQHGQRCGSMLLELPQFLSWDRESIFRRARDLAVGRDTIRDVLVCSLVDHPRWQCDPTAHFDRAAVVAHDHGLELR